MYKITVYNRDKNGNRGSKITESYYETEKEAQNAKNSCIFLCTHPQLAKKEGWTLKNCIITGPHLTDKFD